MVETKAESLPSLPPLTAMPPYGQWHPSQDSLDISGTNSFHSPLSKTSQAPAEPHGLTQTITLDYTPVYRSNVVRKRPRANISNENIRQFNGFSQSQTRLVLIDSIDLKEQRFHFLRSNHQEIRHGPRESPGQFNDIKLKKKLDVQVT